MKDKDFNFKVSQWAIKNNVELNAVEIATLLSISKYNKATNRNIETLEINYDLIRDGLRIEDDKNKRFSKLIASSVNSLKDKGVISFEKVTSNAFIIKQPLIEKEGETVNLFKAINLDDFQTLVNLKIPPMSKIKLIACYYAIISRVFIPTKAKKANQNWTNNDFRKIVNFSTVKSIGELYGVSESSARKHIDKLRELGLIVCARSYSGNSNAKNYYTLSAYSNYLAKYMFILKELGNITGYEILSKK